MRNVKKNVVETQPEGNEILVSSDGYAFELREKSCPTCRVSRYQVLGYRGGKLHRYGLGVTTRIVRCQTCGLIFPNPFPYPVAAQELYGDPEKYFEDKDEERRMSGHRRLVRQLARLTGTSHPSILDVGSGRGELLRAAQLEGMHDVVGLEFSHAMIAYVKERYGIAIVPQTIEEYAAENTRSFDAIVLGGVLEHVYDPSSMIAACAKLARRGTVLYIDTCNEPNLLTMVGNLFNRMRRSPAVFNLSPTWVPYHVFGFNPPSLKRLLEHYGFTITHLRLYTLPTIPSRPMMSDRVKAFVGSQVLRLANTIGLAGNMYVWARRC